MTSQLFAIDENAVKTPIKTKNINGQIYCHSYFLNFCG